MNSKMADELADEELEGLIRYYFIRGFEYMEIIHFFSKYYGKSISERTLHRRLREYGLNRRTNYGINEIEEEVRKLFDGPECLVGYRPFNQVYHTTARNPSSSFSCARINAIFGSRRM